MLKFNTFVDWMNTQGRIFLFFFVPLIFIWAIGTRFFLYLCVCPKTLRQLRGKWPNRVETWHTCRLDVYLRVSFLPLRPFYGLNYGQKNLRI